MENDRNCEKTICEFPHRCWLKFWIISIQKSQEGSRNGSSWNFSLANPFKLTVTEMTSWIFAIAQIWNTCKSQTGLVATWERFAWRSVGLWATFSPDVNHMSTAVPFFDAVFDLQAKEVNFMQRWTFKLKLSLRFEAFNENFIHKISLTRCLGWYWLAWVGGVRN